MPSVTKSLNVANADASPRVPTWGYLAGAPLNVSCAMVPTTSTDTIGSVYEFGFVSSSARMVGLEMMNDATTLGAYRLGLYCNNQAGGTFTQTNGATSTAAAGAIPVLNADRLFSGSVSTVFPNTEFVDVFAPVILPSQATTAASATLRVWELLGLTVDPSYEFLVCMTCTAAPLAVANITLQWKWVR